MHEMRKNKNRGHGCNHSLAIVIFYRIAVIGQSFGQLEQVWKVLALFPLNFEVILHNLCQQPLLNDRRSAVQISAVQHLYFQDHQSRHAIIAHAFSRLHAKTN